MTKRFTKEELDSMCEWMDWFHAELMKKSPRERKKIMDGVMKKK